MIGTAFDVGDDGAITLGEMLGTNGFFAYPSALSADKVYIWDRANSEYLTAFLNSDVRTSPNTFGEEIDFKWCYMDGVDVRLATVSIPSSTGFFYYKETVGEMTWVSERPYEAD